MPANAELLSRTRQAVQPVSASPESLDYLIFNRQPAAREIGRRVLIHRDSIEEFAKLDHASIRPFAVAVEEFQ